MTAHVSRRHLRTVIAALLALCTLSTIGGPVARAQEAMETAAATMPGPGGTIVRPYAHFFRYGSRPDVDTPGSTLDDGTSKLEAGVTLQYGLVRDWSLTLDVPAVFEWKERAGGGDDFDKGLEDLDATLKWRFYKDDRGGIDTVRAALLMGARVASGDDDDFSSQSVNPHLGAVITIVRGRHGFNQDLHFQWNTGGTRENNDGGSGPDDAISAGTAWVYRIAPEQFTSDTHGAWYTTVEVTQLYETNGDYEMRLVPGLMYEGRRWAFEVMVFVPLISELDERPDLLWGVGTGFRYTF